MTEALKINDYFELQKRTNLFFFLFCYVSKENKTIFLRTNVECKKLWILLVSIALQYIHVRGCSPFAALERAFIEENITYFLLQGFILMKLGKDCY